MKRYVFGLIGVAMVACAEKDALVKSMYADRSARSVGDLVTVEIVEESSVSKESSNDRDKSTSGSMAFEFPGMEAGGKPMWEALQLPEWSLDASKEFSASGGKATSDAFSASITVHVTEVLPNGNMMILGDRKVNIDNDIIKFTLTGMIRPDDVSDENAVLSTRIAGASITYTTIGEFSTSQKKGFFSRVTDWIFPF